MSRMPGTAKYLGDNDFRMDKAEVHHLVDTITTNILNVMRDDNRLNASDVAQTSFARLMCQEFNALRERVYKIDHRGIGQPIAQLSQEVLIGRIEKLEKRIEELLESPEKALRIAIDNFKLGEK